MLIVVEITLYDTVHIVEECYRGHGKDEYTTDKCPRSSFGITLHYLVILSLPLMCFYTQGHHPLPFPGAGGSIPA